MPSTRHHQQTDQIVRDSSSTVNISIVSPSVVYGLSSSTENLVPITVRDIVAAVNQLSMGFVLGPGNNILEYINVDDLADIYVRLVADAVKGPTLHDPRLWGPQAYYFANGEEMSFTTYMKALVCVLQRRGILPTNVITDVREVTDMAERAIVNKTAAIHGCGMNVRCRSERAETLLFWKTKSPGLLKTLPGVVDVLFPQDTP
jgi:nucleoside-diphosphate-sugar epimerase